MPATLKLIVTASLAIVATLASLTQVQAAPYGVPLRFGHHSGHEIEHHAKRDVALVQREETTELVKITPTKSGRPSEIGAIQYTKASAIQNWRRAVIGDSVPARKEVPRSLGSHITALLSSMRHVRRGLQAPEVLESRRLHGSGTEDRHEARDDPLENVGSQVDALQRRSTDQVEAHD